MFYEKKTNYKLNDFKCLHQLEFSNIKALLTLARQILTLFRNNLDKILLDLFQSQ